MAGETDFIGQLLQQRHERLQNAVHIGFRQLAAYSKHRAILAVGDLNEQTVVGKTQHNVGFKVIEPGIGFDHLLQFISGLFQALHPALPLALYPLMIRHFSVLLHQIVTAAGDDAVAQAGFVAIGHRWLKRHAEVIGDHLPLHRAGLRNQPHYQEERHHRGHKIGVGDFPRTTVMSMLFLLSLARNDYRGIVFHAVGSADLDLRLALDFTSRTCSSSSSKEGRSLVKMVFRPNSTAICGA